MSDINNLYASQHLENHSSFYMLYNGKDMLGAPSGLKVFDERIEGIFGLVGLTGEPGKGKTSLAIQIACFNAFVLNKPVFYISLEVSKDLLIAKMTSHMTGISIKKILKGGLTYAESILVLETQFKILNNKNLIIIDQLDATFENIEKIILKMKKDYFEKFGVEEEVLTILDYLNIFNDVPKDTTVSVSDDNSRSKAQMLKFIELKNDTKANWLIILAKNKQGYAKKDMGSIKGSGDLEYGFETLISLQSPDEEFPISDYPENPETGFLVVNTVGILMKARWENTSKVIPFYFNGALNRFYEP